MDHGRISGDIAKALKELRIRIVAAKVPPKALDRNMILATWNIREFGKKNRKKEE